MSDAEYANGGGGRSIEAREEGLGGQIQHHGLARVLARVAVGAVAKAPVHESDEGNPGVILDYDREGNVVSIEILDASKRVEDPRKVEYLTDAAAR